MIKKLEDYKMTGDFSNVEIEKAGEKLEITM